MTHDRRLPTLVAAALIAALLAGGGYAIGRATAPDDSTSIAAAAPTSAPAAMRNIGGVAVGVLRTRAGALAAADNYVAAASETIVQRPADYERLVRATYAPAYRGAALEDGVSARAASASAVANYASGGKSVAIVGARRLDSYDGQRASLTVWLGGVTWGPRRKPAQTWSLTEIDLTWASDRWVATRVDAVSRPVPAPTVVRYATDEDFKSATFDRELRAMSAPAYGG